MSATSALKGDEQRGDEEEVVGTTAAPVRDDDRTALRARELQAAGAEENFSVGSMFHWFLLFPLVVWVWDTYQLTAELACGRGRTRPQLFTFLAGFIVSAILLLLLDKKRFRWKSRVLGILGILCTSSLWCFLEKCVEWNVSGNHNQRVVYACLFVLNAFCIIAYERYYRVDLFAKLADIV